MSRSRSCARLRLQSTPDCNERAGQQPQLAERAHTKPTSVRTKETTCVHAPALCHLPE